MGLNPIATFGHGDQNTPEDMGNAAVSNETMLFTFAITALLGTASAATVSEAASLLSRYPQGAVPFSEKTLAAVATLGAEGGECELSLLTDMAAHEVGPIREAVRMATDDLLSRLRLAARTRYRAPSDRQVAAWLSDKQLVADDGRRLGRHEQLAMAYTSLALDHTIGVHTGDWKTVAEQLEAEGHTTPALQQYAAAVMAGELDAIDEFEGFGLNAERVMLGLFVSLPADLQQSSPAYAWLRINGTFETVSVFSDQAGGGTAFQRAMALDSLSEMIRGGHLNHATVAKALYRIERSTRDPHHAIRTLALTTLVEMGG